MGATRLVIIGAGGFGREVHDVCAAIDDDGGAVDVVGYLADGGADVELLPDGVPLLGPVAELTTLAHDVRYVIAIGSGSARRRIDEWATGEGREAATLIHPAAVVSRNRVDLAPGVIVCATSVVSTNVRLGRHAHVNLGATVGHDSVLGDYATLSPNVSLSGNTVLEDEVTMGTAATTIPGVRVGARSVIGACGAVVRDVPADVTAVGVPARPVG